jgi:aspartyl-tRNA(Asn)/glutamyl-tRNA(Gln) amidotransferase subunit B
MTKVTDKYDIVIGLEVHIQLTTNSKLFNNDAALFGVNANENTSAITLGHPGTLPRINEMAIVQAIKLGLALGCSITPINYFSRKHYLYPDLPKGFQTTQHINPICEGGNLHVIVNKEERNVIIHHIHLEEDAGKSIHDVHPTNTAVDFNRAGTPLCELVTEPCITSSEEAYSFLTDLRKLVRWIGVSDGNMEEGSLRCDANISLKLKGTIELGTRVEVKNLNSIKFVKKAIEIEVERLAEILNNGQIVSQETRAFDAATETTFTLRSKEDANDYRYFIEPDLSPTVVSNEQVNAIQSSMPLLPNALRQKIVTEFKLTPYDAVLLTEDIETYNYFIKVQAKYSNAKAAANFINGPIKQYCKEQNISIAEFPITPNNIALTIQLIDDNSINFGTASGKLFNAMLKDDIATPKELIQNLNLTQQTNTTEIEDWIHMVLEKNESKVAEYKKGKKGLIGFFVGEVVKISKGKAEPKTTQALLQEKLQ